MDLYSGNGTPPKGDVSVIRSTRANDCNGYEIESFDIAKHQSGQYFIEEEKALEMLIQSCLEAKIALPKIARKSVREIDSHLCLDLISE